MTRQILGAASIAALALSLGCAGASVKTFAKTATGQRQYGKVKKVVVLPFDSVTEGAQVPKYAADLFLQDILSAGTFEAVEEPRYVQGLMKKLKLRNTEELDREIVRKMGEELKADALMLGTVLLYGQQKESEVVEFGLRVDMIDVESGDIIWSGQTYARSTTTMSEILGVSKGPSPNDVGHRAVGDLVARLNQDFQRARAAEVERMLETVKAQKEAEETGPVPEEAAPQGKEVAPPKEEEGEEILLEVVPK